MPLCICLRLLGIGVILNLNQCPCKPFSSDPTPTLDGKGFCCPSVQGDTFVPQQMTKPTEVARVTQLPDPLCLCSPGLSTPSPGCKSTKQKWV